MCSVLTYNACKDKSIQMIVATILAQLFKLLILNLNFERNSLHDQQLNWFTLFRLQTCSHPDCTLDTNFNSIVYEYVLVVSSKN